MTDSFNPDGVFVSEPRADFNPDEVFASDVSSWKLRRGDAEYLVGTATGLREWAATGRVLESDYIYNPVLRQWMYARDVLEIAEFFRRQAQVVRQQTDTNQTKQLNRMSWGLGCLGALTLLVFWPAGVVLITIAIVMSAFVYLKQREGGAAQ